MYKIGKLETLYSDINASQTWPPVHSSEAGICEIKLETLGFWQAIDKLTLQTITFLIYLYSIVPQKLLKIL